MQSYDILPSSPAVFALRQQALIHLRRQAVIHQDVGAIDLHTDTERGTTTRVFKGKNEDTPTGNLFLRSIFE